MNLKGVWYQLLILEPKISKFWVISGWLKFVFQVDNVHPTDLFRHKIWAQGVNPSKETEQKVSGVLGNKRMRYDGFS